MSEHRRYLLSRHVGFHDAASGRPKEAASEATHAETFFYLKQVEARTPLVFKLRDGEEIRGTVEWYDRTGLRVDLAGGGHVVLQKHAIAYLYKAVPASGS